MSWSGAGITGIASNEEQRIHAMVRTLLNLVLSWSYNICQHVNILGLDEKVWGVEVCVSAGMASVRGHQQLYHIKQS